jgi:uncharacterized phosphatase
MTDASTQARPTRLYLVRHGETNANRDHLVVGSMDVPLNDTGRAQAAATAQLMAARRWDALYASPMSRALETARIIGAATGLGEPVIEPRIVEQDFGSAEGMTERELLSQYPDYDFDAVPGRETDASLVRRVMTALSEIGDRHPGQDVVVVCHGGVIYWVLRTLDPTHLEWGIRNASVHSFLHEPGKLTLIQTDDPLEAASDALGGGEFEEQNPAAPPPP